jgi:TBC1 domain-containing protein 4
VLQVLYIGKIKVSHKKVPDSFIDDALEKFRLHELEKGKSKIVKQGSSHNIPVAGTSAGSSHNVPAAGASGGSSAHLNQAHTPGNNVVIGLCRDEDHCHRESLVSLLQ